MIRYGNETSKCIQTFKSILYYIHSLLPTCFDRSCGHPQGGALEG